MADNVFKGVIDAIAESDNELAGQLITRLRESHIHGRDDGRLEAVAPTRLTSPAATFQASDVGKGLDILEPLVGAPSGFEGCYLVASYVDAYNVTLTKVDGSLPTFTTTSPIRWRFTTLRVETTLDFPQRDRLMRLYIGEETEPIPYSQVVQTPGAQEFRGLGGHRLSIYGVVDSTAPTTLSHEGAFFEATDVGKTLFILPDDAGANGNEGPQLITAVASDGKSCTVSPGGLTADEERVWFQIKDCDDDTSYLTGLRPPSLERRALTEQSPVVDGSQSYSGMDQLRRAMLVDYAEEEELDRIGRNLAVDRPLGLADEEYRCLLKTLAYLPKATTYGLELVLGCLFPGGGYEIYEDLINFPNKIYIIIDAVGGDSLESEGRAFLAPGQVDNSGASPAAVTDYGRGGREKITSTTATTLTVGTTPITVSDVLRQPDEQELEMDVLPSADTPAWTYVNQGAVEGSAFSVSGSLLAHTIGAATDNSGHYKRTLYPQATPGSSVSLAAWFKVVSQTSVTGEPWGLAVHDAELGRSYGLFWGLTTAKLSDDGSTAGQGDETISTLDDGKWHRMELRRETVGTDHFISGYIDGAQVYGRAYRSTDFAAYAGTSEARFGYDELVGVTDTWSVSWDRVRLYEQSPRNYFNSTLFDGACTGSDAILRSASNPFLSGDVDKLVRIHSGDNRVRGRWNIKTFSTAGAVELEGILSDEIVAVASIEISGVGDSIFVSSGTVLVEDAAGVFPDDVRGGYLTISGATNGANNGTFRIIGRESASRIYIENASAITETSSFAWDLLINAVELDDPIFAPEDVTKELEIQGSALSNDGAREVIEYITPKEVRVSGSAFDAELQLQFRFNPYDGTTSGDFPVVSGLLFEIIETGTVAVSAVTLRDALPLANDEVEVGYTTVLSAQVVRNEFVENDGSLGSEPNIFYPFYLFDVDRATRQLLDEITAAGVIPAFEREL